MEQCPECGQQMTEKKVISHTRKKRAVYRYSCVCGFTTSKSKNTSIDTQIIINPYGYCNHQEELNGKCISCGEQ